MYQGEGRETQVASILGDRPVNSTDHEQIQQEIAAYLAGRLTDAESKTVRDHIEACESCAEVVEAWTPVVHGFRAAGKELLEPHPDSQELLQFARGEITGSDSLKTHLETCPTCLLEVEGARAGSALAEAKPEKVVRSVQPIRYVAMALAAGLVLGVGLMTLVLDPGSGFKGLDGASQLYTLEETVRSTGDTMILEVEPGSTVLPLVLLPAIPDDASPEARFTFEILNEQGETGWSGNYSAAELNHYLEVSGVLTLMVPTLPEGAYTMQLQTDDDPANGPLQEFRFQVRQR
jgi:hypothetical protein